MMIKLKYGIAIAINTLLILFAQAANATCTVGPVHISGVVTLHISKYGTNYPLVRDDYKFTTGMDTIVCTARMGDIHVTGSKSLSKSVDIQGNTAWVLPNTGAQQQVAPQFAIEPSMRTVNSTNFVYADGIYSGGGLLTTDVGSNIDLVTLNPSLNQEGGSISYNVPDPVLYAAFQNEGFSTDHPLAYLDNMTVNYIETSCGIKSKQGSVINWPSLYKADIINGTVESKPYSLSLICGKESDTPLPIDISFSSTNGFSDAANGIVRTNLANLGLKLSWANPALPPLMLDQVNHSMLSGVGDYTVMAKPVKLSTSADTLQAGQFDTTVTMNIEFQ